MEVGDQVLVAGQKHGIVRYFGKTDFAPGAFADPQSVLGTVYTRILVGLCCLSFSSPEKLCTNPAEMLIRQSSCDRICVPAGYWFGIELDQPTGKHDGSVFGVRYFSCLPKYGVFAPPSRVQR